MKKVLIVDDEREFCSFIKEALEATRKYKVIIATDGKSAMLAALDHLPDLVLLDIAMPKMDGFETLKMLKEDTKTQGIPVIMITARDDEESKKKASSLFDEGYLVKPIGIDDLKSKIEGVLSRTR